MVTKYDRLTSCLICTFHVVQLDDPSEVFIFVSNLELLEGAQSTSYKEQNDAWNERKKRRWLLIIKPLEKTALFTKYIFYYFVRPAQNSYEM